MSILPPRRSIQELELEDSEQVQLYLELIRIIERDIDEEKAGNTRNGWTSWAIVGGIAGALLLLFGETRKLQTFPTEQVEKIAVAGILLYNIAFMSLSTFSFSLPSIRPGRIRWSKDVLFPLAPLWLYKLLTFLFSIFIIFTLAIPLTVKITALVSLALWSLLALMGLIFSKKKFAVGGSKFARKSAWLWVFAILPLSILAIILLGTQMQFPVGEIATLPYVLAGLIIAVILLIENLISTLAPSRLLSNLKNLRDDIIFLRIEIDEALQRYEVLTEGETLPDALKEELNEVFDHLAAIEYLHGNMRALLTKMSAELPSPGDSQEVLQQKQQQLDLDRDSYSLHLGRCSEISNPLKKKLAQLNKNLSQLVAASEDRAGENHIRFFLTQKLQELDKTEADLSTNFQTIDFYIRNPDKIPQMEASTEGADKGKGEITTQNGEGEHNQT